MVPGWFFSRMHPPELYPGPTIQARSAVRRAAQDLVKIIVMEERNENETFCFFPGEESESGAEKKEAV